MSVHQPAWRLGAPAAALLFAVALFLPVPSSGQGFKGPGKAKRPDFIPAGYDDYQNMLDQLGITKVRKGRDSKVPDTSNEAIASPYKETMPDLMTFKDGTKVTSADQWPKRRAEIVEDFEREVYGRIPKNVPKVTWEVTSTVEGESGGIATVTKTLVGHVDNSAFPKIKVDIEANFTVPKHAAGRVPILLQFGFGGKFAAKFAAKAGANSWTQQALNKGWGYGTIVPTTVQGDNSRLREGIVGLTNKGQPRGPEDWGALRAWAWGVSCLIDYFAANPDSGVDPTKVCITGVSRYGKAALVTAAFDTRVAAGFVASSGAGGAKLNRHIFGELLENVAGRGEYHWMAGNYLKYAADEATFGKKTAADLPVDSHELIALCAPRLCFISNGIPPGDPNWIDARGSFMAGVLAGPAYRLLGKKDLGTPGDYLTDPLPPVKQLIGGELAWRQHDGGHTNVPNFPAFFEWAGRYISAPGMRPNYPATKRVDHVDTYHGTRVSDPYRWLETDVRESKEVSAWVEAENKVTFAYLGSIPQREAIKKRITSLWNFAKVSAPRRHGPRYVFTKNDGLQNQAVYYTQETLDAKPQVLLDPNQWSKDGTVALAGLEFSDDGNYLAYGVSEAGSDWSGWKVMHVPTRKMLGDDIRWVKYGGASWTHDNKGFFYSRFPEPKAGLKYQGLPVNQKLYFHRLGTPQAEDVLVYHRPEQPTWGITGSVTDDGRYLMIFIGDGTTSRKTRVAYKDLNEPYGMPVDLIDNFDSSNGMIYNDGPVMYFQTDYQAPRGRIVAVDTRKPDRKRWKTIVPEAASTLQSAEYTGNLLICHYLQDARTQVKMYRLDGRFVRDVDFPGIGTALGFKGRPMDIETFYTFTSFNTPGRIYRYDLITGKSDLFHEPKVRFNPDDYVVRQVFYQSKDGTKIPMFISHKKGLELNGDNPTLLYAYGGFNISLTPTFSISKLAWMEMGGVYAQANLRGGGEYGQEWHQAATRLKRPKAYEDFIAAGEWLIENKYTRPARLAIQGGSNGGLLVGAVMCKRPDLFGACLPAVGVMDMLRFHKFTAGRFWVDDFGSADDPQEFKVLLSYSPYHNLKPGTHYPATLITTADHDDRVVPSHSFKFAAQLQYCQSGPAPVLIRIETRAGHGAGRPTAMAIEEASDLWAFLVRNLKMTLPY